MNLIKAKNTLRAIALATTDADIKRFALGSLDETEGDAQTELNKTCFATDIDDVRSAVVEINNIKDNSKERNYESTEH